VKGSSHRAATGYGIDLSADHVTVVQVSSVRGKIDHAVILDEPRSAPGGTLPSVADAIAKDTETGGAAAAACMAVHESFTRWLQTPLVSIAKARKVLPSLLDIQLPFPLETCVYHVLQFRRAAGAKAGAVDALAAAARTQDVTARLESLRQSGLDPERIDHEGLALWSQALREFPVERDALRVVAFIGHDHSSFVFGRGPDFQAAHSVRFGLRDVVSGTADATTQLAQRARQAVRTLLPDSAEQAVQWIWTGPGVERADVLDAIRAALGELGTARFLTPAEPASFLARALAVRAVEADSLSCNFRTGALAHALEGRRALAAEARAATAILAAGLLLCALNGGWQWFLGRRMDQVQLAVNETARSLAKMDRIPKGQEVLVARRAIEDRAAMTLPFLHAFEPPLTSVITDTLRAAREKRITLESLSLRVDSAALTGSAEDWNHCEALAELLRERGYSASVERQDAGNDERVHFAIKSSRTDGGAGR
jgi:Tfp pilus assembly PilM family ATPase